LNQRPIVASLTDSPKVGTRISIVILRPTMLKMTWRADNRRRK
jgi:hypothetical protein